jgi:hypothetical protein
LDRFSSSSIRRATIAKNQNTFAKRQREMEKKAKAEGKRARRTARKQEADAGVPSQAPNVDPETPEEAD